MALMHTAAIFRSSTGQILLPRPGAYEVQGRPRNRIESGITDYHLSGSPVNPNGAAFCPAAESRLKGQSINQTVLDLLHQALGLGLKGSVDNGLGKLAGTWSEEEFRGFEKNTALFEELDQELWET
jgi:hypothetical protein